MPVPAQPPLIGMHQGQDENGDDVVKGDRANNHERCGSGGAIDVLNEGHTQQCYTAAVGGLDKFSPELPAEHVGEEDHGQDAHHCHAKAQPYKNPIPLGEKIGAGHVLKEEDGQSGFEYKAVDFIGEGFVHKAYLAEEKAKEHH